MVLPSLLRNLAGYTKQIARSDRVVRWSRYSAVLTVPRPLENTELPLSTPISMVLVALRHRCTVLRVAREQASRRAIHTVGTVGNYILFRILPATDPFTKFLRKTRQITRKHQRTGSQNFQPSSRLLKDSGRYEQKTLEQKNCAGNQPEGICPDTRTDTRPYISPYICHRLVHSAGAYNVDRQK